MGLDTQLDNDFKELMADPFFMTSATYNDYPVSGVWSIVENIDTSLSKIRVGRFEIHKSLIPNIIPVYRDVIVIDDLAWTVKEIIAEDEYTYLLALETNERLKLK